VANRARLAAPIHGASWAWLPGADMAAIMAIVPSIRCLAASVPGHCSAASSAACTSSSVAMRRLSRSMSRVPADAPYHVAVTAGRANVAGERLPTAGSARTATPGSHRTRLPRRLYPGNRAGHRAEFTPASAAHVRPRTRCRHGQHVAVRGKPAVTPTARPPWTPSAIRPWTPRHDCLQRDKMTHDGTEKKRPASARIRSYRGVSAGGGRCWVRTNEGLADGFTDRRLWQQPTLPTLVIAAGVNTDSAPRPKSMPPRMRTRAGTGQGPGAADS